MLRVARFVLPTGLLAAVTVLSSYLLIRKVGASVDEARTMETVIFSVIGLRVIAAIERPIRGWRLGLLLSMAVLLALAFAVPFAQRLLRPRPARLDGHRRDRRSLRLRLVLRGTGLADRQAPAVLARPRRARRGRHPLRASKLTRARKTSAP